MNEEWHTLVAVGGGRCFPDTIDWIVAAVCLALGYIKGRMTAKRRSK